MEQFGDTQFFAANFVGNLGINGIEDQLYRVIILIQECGGNLFQACFDIKLLSNDCRLITSSRLVSSLNIKRGFSDWIKTSGEIFSR